MSEYRPRFYIIDAHAMIHRIFHGTTLMISPKGMEVNAINGVLRSICYLLRDHDPDYLAAAYEAGGKTFRHDFYPEYKANRSEVPQELVKQFPYCRRAFQAYRIPIVSAPKMEADDVIATLATAGEKAGMDVTIVTGDKDLRQLITPNVQIFDPKRSAMITEKTVMDEWGVRPDQVVDYLSLMGDTADNIKGIPGIGKKFAHKYITQFGDLDTLLENTDEVREIGKRETIKKYAEDAKQAREIIRLKTDVPLRIDWDSMIRQDIDDKAMDLLCAECGIQPYD